VVVWAANADDQAAHAAHVERYTYGVGPTVVEGFMRATNLLVAATTFCVVGYGACGRGVARALRADGAMVLVVDRDQGARGRVRRHARLLSEIDQAALGPGERLTEHVSQHGRVRLVGRGAGRFQRGPQPVPPAVDDVVARAMLAALSATR
jgi:hypothetical protein